MRYPTISQYIDALNQSQTFTRRLNQLKLVLSDQQRVIYNSGNFGVVIKVEIDGKNYALKCFTREQKLRAESYAKIERALPKDSPHLLKFEYLRDEILIAPYGESKINSYDVVIMEYSDGETLAHELSTAIRENNQNALCQLSTSFNQLAQWLTEQPFAHGDIKPENIVVSPKGDMILVDYDGIYTPEMRGERQREIGTRAYQHPNRGAMLNCREIDNYSILLLQVSLYVLALEPEIFDKFSSCYCALIINPQDAIEGNSAALNYITKCKIIPEEIAQMLSSKSPIIENINSAIEQISSLSNRLRESLKLKCNGENCIELTPFEIGSKWGYENQNAEEIIAARFDMAWEFDSDGYALVKETNHYGFIGRDGEYLIEPHYDYAAPFNEGYAVGAEGGKYGYIDHRGNWAIEPKYEYARSVRGGRARVELEGKIIDLDLRG